jgi:single-strand DNA-binding protein
MTDIITLTGLVATTPRHLVTSEGLPITSFRLASTQRRFDRSQERWIDGETNWYTVTAFRQLAINVAGSIQKGDRVVTTGRLRIRDWTAGDKAGTNIEVDADAVGHDLSWGTAAFTRSIASAVAEPASPPASETDPAEGEERVEREQEESQAESVAVPF